MPLTSAWATTAGQRAQATEGVEDKAKLVQEMVDSVFSFAEPGFQEFRTSAYLTGILEKEGFTITRGVAGIPTAWTATWGDAGPVIALGSDIDALLGLSQVPGSPQIKPMLEGAPGHGEGHNSGMPMVIAAALGIGLGVRGGEAPFDVFTGFVARIDRAGGLELRPDVTEPRQTLGLDV